MINYELNEFLQPVNSPIALNSGAVTGYQFDYDNERNAVGQSKIAFISADKIATGTLIASVNLGTPGGGYVLIDGPNNRILVNDGTTNRIVIGEV